MISKVKDWILCYDCSFCNSTISIRYITDPVDAEKKAYQKLSEQVDKHLLQCWLNVIKNVYTTPKKLIQQKIQWEDKIEDVATKILREIEYYLPSDKLEEIWDSIEDILKKHFPQD